MKTIFVIVYLLLLFDTYFFRVMQTDWDDLQKSQILPF